MHKKEQIRERFPYNLHLVGMCYQIRNIQPFRTKSYTQCFSLLNSTAVSWVLRNVHSYIISQHWKTASSLWWTAFNFRGVDWISAPLPEDHNKCCLVTAGFPGRSFFIIGDLWRDRDTIIWLCNGWIRRISPSVITIKVVKSIQNVQCRVIFSKLNHMLTSHFYLGQSVRIQFSY